MKRILAALAKRYVSHDIAQASAALAYNLLFAFFPFLLLLGWLMGSMRISDTVLLQDFGVLLPDEILEIVRVQLETNVAGRNWLVTGGTAMVLYAFTKNSNTLIRRMENAMGCGCRRKPVERFLIAFGFALLLLAVTVVALSMIIVSRNTLNFLISWFDLPPFLKTLWQYGRFALLAALALLLLCILYGVCAGGPGARRPVFPGAMVAMTAWLCISVGFSFYVSAIGKYTVIYGSIGAVVILLLWLYLTAMLLLLGGELNGVLGEQMDQRAEAAAIEKE